MSAPLHTRPFNMEHARAGAPHCCANGETVEILKWDRKNAFCVVGLADNERAMRAWRADGTYTDFRNNDFRLVMTPLGFVEGKPVFAGDVLYEDRDDWGNGGHFTVGATMRQGYFDHCKWPEPEEPAKVYPETRMTPDELSNEFHGEDPFMKPSLRHVANAAIRHAVDSGQVMLPGGEMSDEVILKAIHEASDEIGWFANPQVKILLVNTVRSLLVTEPEIDKLKADLRRTDRNLGNAERLLEQLGYSSAGDGEWVPRPAAAKHFYGDVNGFHVEGDESSIKVVKELTARGVERDMAVAEAVLGECKRAVSRYSKGCHDYLLQHVDLADIIARVKS